MLSAPEMTAVPRFDGSTCPIGVMRPHFAGIVSASRSGYSSLHHIAALVIAITTAAVVAISRKHSDRTAE